MIAFFPKDLSACVDYKLGNNDTKKNNSRNMCIDCGSTVNMHARQYDLFELLLNLLFQL